MLELMVNGKHISVPEKPGEMLSDLLRDRLGLTGTKVGCNEAECGSCTVLVDGNPVLSCNYPASRAAGCEIVTIEGLADLAPNPGVGKLHPIQEAFVQHGAVQCGFCMPGEIIASYALLKRNPDPSDAEIRYALKDNLCRCAGYNMITQAVQAAAKSLRTGEPVEMPVLPISSRPGKVVGKHLPRPEAVEKVNGKALFTDDLVFPNMLHGATKRAGIPHGIVKSIETQKAKDLPGVVAVLTAADLPAARTHGLVVSDWPIMVGVGERVRYVGDAIAVVAAETRAIAQSALELINVEYEPHLPICDPVTARQPEAEQLHASGNLLKHIKVKKGDMAAGFAGADVVMEHVFHTPTTEHAFLEPECSVARLTDDERIEVYVGSQIPYQDREQVAKALGWPEERVHIIGMLIGGGFGGKEDIAGQIHAALLANITKRPVKILYDRHESLLVHPKRHATQIRVKVGAKKDGRLIAVETELYGDSGAYASLSEKVMTRATTHSAGPYNIPNVKADCYAMYTNNPPAGAFRGFGVTQSAFAVESMMDMLADELGIDSMELRRINALKVGDITNTGQELRESVGLLECIEKVSSELERLGVQEPFKSQTVPSKPYLKRSWGMAVAYKNTGLGGGAPDFSGAEIELYQDGSVEIRTSAAEIGQGLVTVLRMIVAEEMGIQPERVHVLLSDTDLTPDAGPTTASRQTFVTGNAARHAAISLREAISSTLAEKWDCPPDQIHFEDGNAISDGHRQPLGEVATEMVNEGRSPKALYQYWAPETKPLGEGGDMHFAFSYAAQAAEVEVNTRTGEVTVLRVISATDVGTTINPLGLEGQFEGGVMMGLGNALTEHFIVENGTVFTDRLARYRMPSITQSPQIITFAVEHPTEAGPYGAKGIGEIVSIPTSPAITNAIYHAVGVRVDELPVDQEWIATQIREKSAQR